MAAIDLSPARLDISGIRAGDRNLITMTLTSGGVPMNLTGKTVAAQARVASNDTGLALAAVVTVTNAATGDISVRWPGPAVSTLLGTAAKWSGVWDLQVTTPSEDPITVVAGSFAAEMDVTRP
jgi:hypothetical protein